MNRQTLLPSLFAIVSVLGLLPSPAQAQVGAPERKGSVTGMVWFDANANGKPDAQERAIRGLYVDLEGPDYRETRRTAENGTYQFAVLPPGQFRISVRLPADYGLSTPLTPILSGVPIPPTMRYSVSSEQFEEGENPSPDDETAPEPTPNPFTRELTIDGRTALRNVDWGVARLEALEQTQTDGRPSASGNGSSALSDRPGVSFGSGPSRSGSLSPPRVAQATPIPPPTATLQPTSIPTLVPTATPPPTRTPSAIDVQQVAAERARAAIEAPQAPRTGSTSQDDNVMLDVPFRSAVDGTEYADTNSGTAAVGMILESYGVVASTEDLRSLVNILNRTYDVSQPPRIDALARLAEQSSIRGLGLYQQGRFAVWSPDDVRERIKAGFPVLTQFRPADAAGPDELGRERYVVIVGWRNGSFVYHDPAYPDSRGAGREIAPAALTRAWADSPNSSQAVAFGLGRSEIGLLAPPGDLLAAQQNPDKAVGVREVVVETTPVPSESVAGQVLPLKPVEAEQAPVGAAPTAPGPGGPQLHPLLIAFMAVAGLVLARVVAGFFLD